MLFKTILNVKKILNSVIMWAMGEHHAALTSAREAVISVLKASAAGDKVLPDSQTR